LVQWNWELGGRDGLALVDLTLNVYNQGRAPSEESNILSGVRALMNDTPILDTIATVMGVSMVVHVALW